MLLQRQCFIKRKTKIYGYTVKPVLRGHMWDNEKWPYNTGDLLKEVQFI